MNTPQRKKMILRTNIMLCAILLLGFIIVSAVSYNLNIGVFEKDIENLSTLTSEGIYYQIDSFFSRPVNISLTMANDSLLKRFLSGELQHLDDAAYWQQLKDYLYAYRDQYGYDSVFLVSTQTNRYYHFNGLHRTLEPDNPENKWYYAFLQSYAEYSLNVDNDEVGDDIITVFINCKIKDANGTILGVVGVGLKINHLQDLLQNYVDRFHSTALLVDEKGIIQISSDDSGGKGVSLFDQFPGLKDHESMLLGLSTQSFWEHDEHNDCFIVSRYIPSLKWHLVIENDATLVKDAFKRQLLIGSFIILLIIGLVLYVVNKIIWKYNDTLFRHRVSQELEYQQLLRESTEGLYENIFELNITRNCAGSKTTEDFFASLGLSRTVSYSKALQAVAQKQIKKEFAQGYLTTFSIENILRTYESGLSNLHYDLIISTDGRSYHWMRITGRIFFWASDQSIRMITYRQNIDETKKHELEMLEMAQKDPLTGLYNKRATEELINEALEISNSKDTHALLMLDIDGFKGVNDNLGHAAGDLVLTDVANLLKKHFRSSDLCGRIGGDEFVVLIQNIPDIKWLERRVQALVSQMRQNVTPDHILCPISASIGIALYPESGTDFRTLYRKADIALYQIKNDGKNGFSIYYNVSEAT